MKAGEWVFFKPHGPFSKEQDGFFVCMDGEKAVIQDYDSLRVYFVNPELVETIPQKKEQEERIIRENTIYLGFTENKK